MTRPLAFAVLCLLLACREEYESGVRAAPPELVEVTLDATDTRLSFHLPDAEWRRVEDPAFKGFRYERSGSELRVQIQLKESLFRSAEALARKDAAGAVIRAFEPASPWPYVGVVLSYRGPPDEAMLDALVHSFKVERR